MSYPSNDQFLNFVQGTNRLENTIAVYVESGQITNIISFLTTNKIPFFVSSSGFSDETAPDKKETAALVGEPKIAIPKTISKVEQVFQKYFNQGAATILPSLEVIAEEAGVSVSDFKSIFKKIYGNTFFHYSIEKKMEYAAELLRQGLKASEVSVTLGYAHPIKFNKMFQRYFGMTPKKYQTEFYTRHKFTMW